MHVSQEVEEEVFTEDADILSLPSPLMPLSIYHERPFIISGAEFILWSKACTGWEVHLMTSKTSEYLVERAPWWCSIGSIENSLVTRDESRKSNIIYF
jgi:hypothetical protein